MAKKNTGWIIVIVIVVGLYLFSQVPKEEGTIKIIKGDIFAFGSYNRQSRCNEEREEDIDGGRYDCVGKCVLVTEEMQRCLWQHYTIIDEDDIGEWAYFIHRNCDCDELDDETCGKSKEQKAWDCMYSQKCDNKCSYVGERDCSGGLNYVVCKEDNNGCLYWEENSCDSDEICVNGECEEKKEGEECKDSDGGIDYYNKGIVTKNSKSYEDYCYSDSRITEYYCTDYDGVGQITANCASGYVCSDGACVEDEQPDIVEYKSPQITIQGSNVFGYFYLENAAEDMDESRLLEMQIVDKGSGLMAAYSTPGGSTLTCNENYPWNVHDFFQLDSGEQIIVNLLARNVEPGTYDIWAVSVNKCGGDTAYEPYMTGYDWGKLIKTITISGDDEECDIPGDEYPCCEVDFSEFNSIVRNYFKGETALSFTEFNSIVRNYFKGEKIC